MPKITSLITRLETDYPELSFLVAKEFMWSADRRTVSIDTTEPHAEAYCLHELSHAVLGHDNYSHDIELLKLERDAWEYAKTTLAPRYNVIINETISEDNLDTYREWLHARSTCPTCSANGVQTSPKEYRCLACGLTWRVNEARICALRRYKN